MSVSIKEVYPKVVRGDRQSRINVIAECTEGEILEIKIQPMEIYKIPHTERYRIDEEDRYPYVSAQKSDTGAYFIDYDFEGEQQYTFKIKVGEKIVFNTYLYSLAEDLSALRAYKGDTHLHTNRSDGEGTPFEVACNYRRAGFDFIAITDHHKYAPSLEAKAQIGALTDMFCVLRGEEVHNKDMGYFHVVNFDGEHSINDIIETDDAYVEREIEKILANLKDEPLSDPRGIAYRIFIANEIRRANGIAIMAHPFWDVYGEYHMQTEDVRYLWKNGCYDALEVIAACDRTGHGSNLQGALWADMRAEGLKIPVVGASDAHKARKNAEGLFDVNFSIIFAADFDEIKSAIKDERSVAVERFPSSDFRAVGRFRYVKYARFLLSEYFPRRDTLTERHADALASCDARTEKIILAEGAIEAFDKRFFNL